MIDSARPKQSKGRARDQGNRMRRVFLLIHRYVGLSMAAFLIVAGVTGSLITFVDELDELINPELMRAAVIEGRQQPLDPFALREQVQKQLPKSTLDTVVLDQEPGRTVGFWAEEKEYFADPHTGKIVGSRTWGDLSEGRKNLMPFIYRLHFTLALGDVGRWLFGIVAILWTLDCFVGVYLTFPPRLTSQIATARRRSWLERWAPAWLIKTSKLFSFVFTWHRASGLWVWLFSLIFAWSAVGLNLHDEVYDPVMSLVVHKHESAWDRIPELTHPKTDPKLNTRAAYEVARPLMTRQGEQRGFRVLSERWMSYHPEQGVYSYWVESTWDVSHGLGETHVIFDGDTGKFRGFSARAGLHAGDTFFTWLVGLHFGAVRLGGLPYRIFVCVFGVLVVTLSVTGVWIWWRRKHKAKLRTRGVRLSQQYPTNFT